MRVGANAQGDFLHRGFRAVTRFQAIAQGGDAAARRVAVGNEQLPGHGERREGKTSSAAVLHPVALVRVEELHSGFFPEHVFRRAEPAGS